MADRRLDVTGGGCTVVCPVLPYAAASGMPSRTPARCDVYVRGLRGSGLAWPYPRDVPPRRSLGRELERQFATNCF